jgi:hypothetical protein
MTALSATLHTGGETLAVDCDLPWLVPYLVEGADGRLEDPAPATVRLHVEADHRPFPTDGWSRISRDGWARSGEVVLRDVATSGFDVLMRTRADGVDVVCRWQPPPRTRAAALLLRTRARLLLRAVLLQYPVLWAGGLRGRVPLHACGVTSAASGAMLIVGPSGVGKTTVVEHEVAAGGSATTDNLCVADVGNIWGLVEPVRSESGPGRRAPHGRHEGVLARRISVIEPQVVVVLERGERTELHRTPPGQAARALVASTYAAGELRRYWPFHAQVALGTGAGAAHPPIADVAAAICAGLPCVRLTLARARDARLADVLTEEGLAR